MKKNILKFILLIIVLFIISFTFIVIKGNTYELKIPISYIEDKNNINIEQNKTIKIVKKDYDDKNLKLKIKALNKGKAYIELDNYIEVIYVHNFNVITVGEYLGKSSGDIILPICIIILLIYIIYNTIKKYLKNVRKNLYQYKNIFYLGIILFLVLMILKQIFMLFNYNGLIDSIRSIIESFHNVIVLLPIISISFIFVTISNIKLLFKEGFSIKNMLGVLLGILLCLLTVLPDIMYRFTYSGILINIHNIGSISYYIYTFIETFIYMILAYLECILFGTIIIAIKAAFHIPKRNKDYIIILGCRIRNNGTLTPLLKSRVDKAIEFYKLQKEEIGKELTFVASGGKGCDEVISEAEAIKNYLLERGIKENQIIVEDKSTNTYENIKNSYKVINKKDANVAFSTTKYHVFRAGIIATKQNILIEGIGSKTKSYFWINAFIREFIATLDSEKKKHILVLIILSVICIIMILIMSISMY